MSKYEDEARKLIDAWLVEQKIKRTGRLRHVFPRCQVLGYAASGCIVISVPWIDSEKLVRDWDQKYPLDIIRTFDKSLKAGDWCAAAYVCRADGCQETVAVGWK